MGLNKEAAADSTVVGHLSITQGPWKYVLADYGTRRKPLSELYDLRVDPGEKNDVSAAYPDLVGAMERDVRAWWETERTGVEVDEQPADPELEAQLRALGYVK